MARGDGSDRKHSGIAWILVVWILAALGIEPAPGRIPAVSGEAAMLLALVREAPSGADELVRRSGLAADAVAAALVRLELEGLVVVADGRYRSAG